MRKLLFILIALSVQLGILAQERTHMPYSIYGIGEILPKGFARNMAMGGTGLALSTPGHLNNVNPASYYGIDSVSFFFDFGLSGNFVKYKTSKNKAQRGNDFNIRNLAMGFRISPNWSSSIGIAPYSSVGYKIQTTEEIVGKPSETFNVEVQGNGGLNKFYWDNSYLLFDRLSLGVNFSYLFGKLESVETVTSSSLPIGIDIKQTSYINKLYADFGLQYFFAVKKDYKITLGGVFGKSHNLNMKNTIEVEESNGLVSEETLSGNNFEFPLYAGAGFAVQYKNLLVTADYLYHDWSNTSSGSLDFSYKSTNAFRLGLEMIPGRYSKLGYFGGIAYRAGLYLQESYLEINNNSIADKGLTVGVGLPFLQNRTSINISYNYGINGTLENNLIKENYHSFLVSLTLHDWWFIKRKID